MPRCVVKDCLYYKSANYKRDMKNVHLFRFPKDIARREVWKKALNLENEVFVNSNVCNLHFDKDSFDFKKSPFALHLKQSAVPKLETSEAQNKTKQSTSSADVPFSSEARISDVNVTDFSQPITGTSFSKEKKAVDVSQKYFGSGIEKMETPAIILTPRERKLKKKLFEAQKKIERLNSTLQHYKKRAATLANVVKLLDGKVTEETLEALKETRPDKKS